MSSLTFFAYRDAIIADIKANLVTTAGVARPFLDVKPAPRSIDERWLKLVSVKVPSIHIAFIGSARRIERNQNGELIGPWTSVAHIVCSGRGLKESAEDVLLKRMTDFCNFLEGRRFIQNAGLGPAIISEVENLWDIQLEAESLAIGSVAWMQDVPFGVDLQATYNAGFGPMDMDGVPLPLPDDGMPNPPDTLNLQVNGGDPEEGWPDPR